jgi:23S rRNA (pseudouridine1915-N3)-methyltransferase
MRYEIIAVGKLTERFWRDACDEYLKRLGAYAGVGVHEVRDEDERAAGGQTRALALEAAGVRKLLPQGCYTIALDIHGEPTSSERLAALLQELGNGGKSTVAFVIGGSNGLDEQLKKEANRLVSFGPITLPHNLARVVLLEQLYRAHRINRKEPYHK